MAKIHDLFIIELAEVIKGYGNDPDVEDPFRLSEFYRFYELPNIAVSRENFEKMRPAQPEQRWILCSERLPEIKQHVLLSCYGRVIYGRMISEDGNSGYPVFEICDSVGEKRPIVLETTVHSEFTTSRIIAWMPLPPSYQGEENG